jgi:hypothetical protein
MRKFVPDHVGIFDQLAQIAKAQHGEQQQRHDADHVGYGDVSAVRPAGQPPCQRKAGHAHHRAKQADG